MIVGGAQENTLLTLIGHIRNGHDAVLVTGPSPGPEGELLKKRDVPDLKTVVNPHLVRELNPVEDLRAYFSLKKYFAAEKFDVVHTHSSKAGIVGRFAARASGVPVVVHTVHGQAFHPYEEPWKNFMYKTAERLAARKSDRIFAVAQAMIDQCVAANVAGREKYKLVYSGMELENLLEAKPDCELRRKLGIPEGAPVVGSIARLFPLKGYEYFVPAAAEIAKSHPETYFLILGDGIWMDKIAKEAKDLKLNFVFAGLVPPGEVCRYTALMDLLMHLSLREGLPRAVVQALASAKPAIGFDLDGTPEVILHGKTGFIARPEDAKEVAKFAVRLLEDKKLAAEMGAAGRRLVKDRFDWRTMVGALEEEYRRLLR